MHWKTYVVHPIQIFYFIFWTCVTKAKYFSLYREYELLIFRNLYILSCSDKVFACKVSVIVKQSHHSSVGIFGTITESGSKRAGTALVVVRVLSIINGTVDGYCPHRCSVAITVAIVFFTTVTGSPHINVSQTIPALLCK